LLSILFAFGALLQFLFFLMPEFRFFLKQIKIKSNFKSAQLGFKNIAQLSLASGLSSLNLIIDQSFALALGEGSNTYIHYGNYFVLIYTFLIVNNISTIFFPQFQKYIISNQKYKLEDDARKVIRIILILNLFIIILVLNNGYFFLNLLLGYGKIVGKDLEIIYLCTMAYSGAFLGLAINAIQVRILHVYNHYRIIVWVAVLNSFLNILFNYIFSKWFGVWGIALSTSVTLFILISVYFVYLNRRLAINLFREGNYNWIIRFIVVACLVGIIEFYFMQHIHRSLEIDILWNGIIILASILFLMSLMYIFRVIRVRNRKIIF
jgi:putative peptidoglycan lipid II flippase